MLTCKICSKTFDNIPSGAVPVSQTRHGYQLFRFKNGELHDLGEIRPPALTREQLKVRGKRGAHTRRHVNRNIKKENCQFCFPSQSEPIKKSTAPDAEEKKS